MDDFVVPADWLAFCEIDSWHPKSECYPWSGTQPVELVAIEDIQPPRRKPGMEPFHKYKLVPVLLAFMSPECALPPVAVEPLPQSDNQRVASSAPCVVGALFDAASEEHRAQDALLQVALV